jgi:hypothetical protein
MKARAGRRRCFMICRGEVGEGGTKCQNMDIKLVEYIVTLHYPDITEWKIKTKQ